MPRLMGFALIAIAVLGVLTQRLVGLNSYVNDVARHFLGPHTSGAYASPVGEAAVYAVFYFIGVLGLAAVATAKPKR